MAEQNKQPVKTYVLIGDGWNEANSTFPADAIRIHAEAGVSLEEAIKNRIKTPANIILAAQCGEDGTFAWHNGEYLHYYQLKSALPTHDILDISIQSIADETGGIVDRILHHHDDIDPAALHNAMMLGTLELGGNPPKIVNLDDEAQKLARQLDNGNDMSVNLNWHVSVKKAKASLNAIRNPDNPDDITSRQLNSKIDDVAFKMRHGYSIGTSGDAGQDADEKGIARALTASYLDHSGRIAQWKAEQLAQAPHPDGKPYPVAQGLAIPVLAFDQREPKPSLAATAGAIHSDPASLPPKPFTHGTGVVKQINRSENTVIREMQEHLGRGVVQDGILGNLTQSAFNARQHEKEAQNHGAHFHVTGKPDILSAVDQALKLQIAVALNHDKVSGGDRLSEADINDIAAFQQQQHLNQTGILDDKTRKALEAASGGHSLDEVATRIIEVANSEHVRPALITHPFLTADNSRSRRE